MQKRLITVVCAYAAWFFAEMMMGTTRTRHLTTTDIYDNLIQIFKHIIFHSYKEIVTKTNFTYFMKHVVVLKKLNVFGIMLLKL